MKVFSLFFTAIFFFCSNLFAANSTVGNAAATIAPAINISKASDLNFGTISVGSNSGIINNEGSTTGGIEIVDSSSSSPAIFDVSGLGDTSYNFTIPDEVTLTDSSSNEIIADLFFANGNSARSLAEAGIEEVAINGSLNVNANQAIGNYSGTYNVNVAY
jgi:spore coat protein U-like protein